MNKTLLVASTISVVALGALLARSLRAGDRRPMPAPVAGARDASVRAIVSARPFVLDRPFVHVWRAEQPSYDAGWLLVLDVDPSYVVPRQMAEPVLYFGNQTVERINHGHESGRVVAVLPSARGADGSPSLDLSSAPFFFGSEELPETVDARTASFELARALRQGASPFDSAQIAAARAHGGDLVRGSREDVDEAAALLILDHSPDEHDLATGMLVPRGR